MKETEGSCKKRRKKMLDEAHDDGVLLSQENVSTCKKCCNSQITHGRSIRINGSPTSPLLLQGQNCPNITGPKEPERIANFDQSSASIDTRPSSESKPSASSNSAPPKGGRSWGLIWVKKPEDDGTEFRIKHLLLKGQNNVDSPDLVCHLCKHTYNSEWMYIRCDTCMRWFHAVAVELDESKILQLVGFKCCRCRRIRSRVCPYDETKKNRPLEKRGNVTVQPYSGTVTLSEAACALNALEHDATEVRNQVKCSSAPKGPLLVPNTVAFKPLSEHDAPEVRNQVECSSAPKRPLQVPDTAAFKPLSDHDAVEVRNQVEFSNGPKGPLQVPEAAEEAMTTNGTQGAASNHSLSNDEVKAESSIDNRCGRIPCENEVVASMLRRIFDKHKDIARECKIKNRNIIVPIFEMICSFCQKLENTTLKTIKKSELEDMTMVVENFQQMAY